MNGHRCSVDAGRNTPPRSICGCRPPRRCCRRRCSRCGRPKRSQALHFARNPRCRSSLRPVLLRSSHVSYFRTPPRSLVWYSMSSVAEHVNLQERSQTRSVMSTCSDFRVFVTCIRHKKSTQITFVEQEVVLVYPGLQLGSEKSGCNLLCFHAINFLKGRGR